ncbi:unnamed protein product [Clonostachys solani]|uniref:Uncharacterized protein n=1 Tax=Clonostachys solani TaxID=160281 RepID=A0A9N9Z8H4_9HYPO|nr:unnamed protein product [Clonostachys solani]
MAFYSFLVRWLRKRKSDQLRDLPSISWLLEHRAQLEEDGALTRGRNPTASLYRMYEYLVIGYITGLRSEIEFFFNQPTWAVSAIPDPQDPDAERYAILAVLPTYLVTAFNRLIEKGLPRGSPAIIAGPKAEEELRARPRVLEKTPAWSQTVAPLSNQLIIPDGEGKVPPKQTWSPYFLEMNIIVEDPHTTTYM